MIANLYNYAAIFKLTMLNTAFWLITPTVFAKIQYNDEVNKRIEHMWRTHKYRTDKGLGPTFSESGFHEGMTQDSHVVIPSIRISMFEIITGRATKQFFDVPHMRWHKSFENYPSHLSDVDDTDLDRVTEFERLKKYKAKKKNVIGSSRVIPHGYHDEIPEFDEFGESLYSNPPDPQHPLIDHGLDEDHIWAFQKTLYNQNVIKNDFLSGNANPF